MMGAIRTPNEKEKSEGTYFMLRYDPILLCLKKELEKAESYGYDIASHIPLEIKEEFILFLLDKYKRRRSLIEKKSMRLELIKYVSNKLGYKISWEKLYKEQVFGLIYCKTSEKKGKINFLNKFIFYFTDITFTLIITLFTIFICS